MLKKLLEFCNNHIFMTVGFLMGLILCILLIINKIVYNRWLGPKKHKKKKVTKQKEPDVEEEPKVEPVKEVEPSGEPKKEIVITNVDDNIKPVQIDDKKIMETETPLEKIVIPDEEVVTITEKPRFETLDDNSTIKM
jgi:predicted membrane protein